METLLNGFLFSACDVTAWVLGGKALDKYWEEVKHER